MIRLAAIFRPVALFRPVSILRPVAFLLATALLLASPGMSQEVKMATLSPDGSPWDTILEKMGERWEASTGGRVTLTLYPGGVAGDEPDIIRKMKIGQYQGGAISVSGLTDIDKDFTIFGIPLFYDSFEEMRYVLDELTPTLSRRLEENGFKLIAWGYVGFVHFFTTSPVHSLADLQSLKIFTWAGDENMVQWWRSNGFKPVALAATDILTGLETGMIEAFSMPPLYAMQMQYYKKASYMIDLGLAPMMGAVLITKKSWDQMAEGDRRSVLAAGEEAEQKVLDQIPLLDQTAIKLMQSQGLEVTSVGAGDGADEWLAAAERFAENMRGTVVPEAIFDEARAARDTYRQLAQDVPGSAGSGTP